jgi:hypothetical protein
MKIVCIYHRIDLDGWMSAAIVKHWFNQQEVPNKKGEDCNTLDFLGWNYGDEIPDLSEYDKVVMCDISFPLEKMNQLMNTYKDNFIYNDHHISAIKPIDEQNVKPLGCRSTEFAACELTWEYFFPDNDMPEIVRLLGMYDSFRHKDTEEEQKVLEFQYGARQVITNYKEAYKWLVRQINEPCDLLSENTVEMIIWDKGEAIYDYLCTEAKQTYKNGFEIELKEPFIGQWGSGKDDRKFICFNKERFNPVNFGIDYHNDGYDGAACFWYNGDKWAFSLYNDNGKVDCSQIAKQYGGGGHKGAAGFRIKNIEKMF